MWLWALEQLATVANGADQLAALESFSKATFRGGLAGLLSFSLALLLGPRLIRWLKFRFQEQNRLASPELRQLREKKQWTPTLGGLFVIAGLLVSTVVCGDLGNRYLPIVAFVAVGMMVLGVWEDLLKLQGVAGQALGRKLLAQVVVALAAATWVYLLQSDDPASSMRAIPGLGRIGFGPGIIPLAALVIVASANGVNQTDGLDGLAGGCLLFAIGALAIVAHATGHAGLAAYLHVPRIEGVTEMVIVAGGIAGGVLGFLWFNCHPAQVFMGDTGALPLGGLLGLLAVITRQEVLLVVIGGVYVVETGSVLVQLASERWRGRGLLACAPLHNHLQVRGWPENKVVVRFWICAALCAVLGILGLKLQGPESPWQEPGELLATQETLRR